MSDRIENITHKKLIKNGNLKGERKTSNFFLIMG